MLKASPAPYSPAPANATDPVRAAQAPLHRAFVRLQQPVLFRRGKVARAALLEIIHRRTQRCLAQCWFAKVLLRSAFVVWRPAPMQRQELSGEPEVERLPSSPFVLSDSAFSRSQAAGGNAPGVGTRRLNELHQAETWQSSSLPHSPDSRSRQVPGPPKPVASQPRSALLRVQQEGFLRWWRAIRMDLGKEELAEQRRKAALLVLLRQRSQSMIAVRHYVAALQRKAVSGFQRAADEEAISRRLSRRAKSRRANRASHRTHVGLRGMSAAEVMRKGWRRWRYAVLSGQRVVCQFERPANVTLKSSQTTEAGFHRWISPMLRLCQIASEIDSCRSKVHGLEPCTQLVRSSSVDEAWSVLALPPPAEAVPEVPEHLRLLKQASVAFDDEQTGWLGRTSKGASPPSVLWEHASTVRQGAGHENFSGWPADVVWSPPRPARPPRGTEGWKDGLCSTDSPRTEDAPGILPDPHFVPQWTEVKESYQTLRGRIRTSRTWARCKPFNVKDGGYQKAAEGCEDRRSLLKETRNIQFEAVHLPQIFCQLIPRTMSLEAHADAEHARYWTLVKGHPNGKTRLFAPDTKILSALSPVAKGELAGPATSDDPPTNPNTSRGPLPMIATPASSNGSNSEIIADTGSEEAQLAAGICWLPFFGIRRMVLPKYGIEATEKGTSIMAAWISSAQNGIKDVDDKVAASMHLSRIAYASKLPLAKNKAKEAVPTPAQTPQTQSVAVERAPFPEKKASAPPGKPPPAAPPKATPLGVATPPVAFGSPPWQPAKRLACPASHFGSSRSKAAPHSCYPLVRSDLNMPRHSNSYACGMDIPEVAFDKRCRRSSHRPMGGTKVQKHPGKQSLDLERGVHLSSIDEHEFWYESDDQEVSDQTTASPEAEEEDDFDESGWDFVAEPVRERRTLAMAVGGAEAAWADATAKAAGGGAGGPGTAGTGVGKSPAGDQHQTGFTSEGQVFYDCGTASAEFLDLFTATKAFIYVLEILAQVAADELVNLVVSGAAAQSGGGERQEAREEWPSLQGNSALDALETMSMASDLTLCSWVDVADEESEVVSPQAAPTWAARLGTSTAPRPSKAALPWAHRRPRARNASIVPEDHDDIEDAADVAALRSWNKWQKSSRNTKAMQKTAEKIHRRFEQSRRAKGDEL
ncbi:hypothetical protein AK812_SmicGene26839 [Symbiodinium microadriaticum]|uniref:Uncharacterized protein n=1 Tax=Symbiodinium microadriaticum TaxID=2951 RepID=A0A1Q9D8I6_SYMMI|nr:hypothetical protein AK812_SmicGene26839 [Symbiodinium microadriaticum]